MAERRARATALQGHYQPHLPRTSASTTCACRRRAIEQAELARRYGIHGFCYYYYWFSGRRLLAAPAR